MKKLLSSLLAVLMAALALGLSACNDNSTGENSGGNGNLPAEHTHEYAATWSSDETEHWHACTGENCTEVKDKAAHTWNDGEITTPATETADGIKTFTCTVCEKTKTESVEYVPTVSYEVTDTEWLTVLSSEIKVFTATIEQEGVTAPIVQKIDLNKQIIFDTQSGYAIYTKEQNNFYNYTSANGQTWVRESITETEYNRYIQMCSGGLSMIMNGLKDKYSSFTYENNSYTAKNLELNPMGIMNEVSLVFEDGVLKTLDFKIDNTEMKMTQHIEIGVADIEIPTDFTEKTA